jgi:hypothetical protein
MSKAPKKIPTWMASFAEFTKKAETDESTHRAIDTFAALMTKHWESFHSHMEAKKQEKPEKKKRTADPMKTLESAMDRVAGHVEEAKGNDELMKQYQERMKEIVPDELKPILHTAVNPTQSNVDVSRLIKSTTKKLSTLKQATQKVLAYANINQYSALQIDAELAVKSVDQVTQDIGELRDVLQ